MLGRCRVVSNVLTEHTVHNGLDAACCWRCFCGRHIVCRLSNNAQRNLRNRGVSILLLPERAVGDLSSLYRQVCQTCRSKLRA